jgi:hypothetical protein
MRCEIGTALVVALLASGAAWAQSPLPKSGPLPAQGKPPATVFSLPPAERFKATDVNADGKVTKEEFKAVLNPEAQKSIERIWLNRDTNTDGWLTAEEMNANGASRLAARPPGAPAAAAANAAAPDEN